MWVWSVLVVLVILGIVVIVWKYCYFKDNFFMDSKWIILNDIEDKF